MKPGLSPACGKGAQAVAHSRTLEAAPALIGPWWSCVAPGSGTACHPRRRTPPARGCPARRARGLPCAAHPLFGTVMRRPNRGIRPLLVAHDARRLPTAASCAFEVALVVVEDARVPNRRRRSGRVGSPPRPAWTSRTGSVSPFMRASRCACEKNCGAPTPRAQAFPVPGGGCRRPAARGRPPRARGSGGASPRHLRAERMTSAR